MSCGPDNTQFYKLNPESGKYVCTYCGKALTSKRTSNWKRHYKLIHNREIRGRAVDDSLTDDTEENKDMLCLEEPTFTHVELMPQGTTPPINDQEKRQRKRKRIFMIEPKETTSTAATPEDTSPKYEGEFEALGKNVARKFQRMDEEQRLYAELLINKLLIHGIKGRLQEETDFNGLLFAASSCSGTM